jgi:hypothetical protein
MKKTLLGALVVAGLVMAAIAGWDRPTAVYAQRLAANSAPGGEQGVIAFSTPSPDNANQVTVIDSRQRAMAVYRIDALTGKIKLLSARNITWDLQLTQLNSEIPLPLDVRSMTEQR